MRFFPGSLTYLTHVFTLTNVVVHFYFYPSAVKALLGIFDCDTVDTRVASYPLMVRRIESEAYLVCSHR